MKKAKLPSVIGCSMEPIKADMGKGKRGNMSELGKIKANMGMGKRGTMAPLPAFKNANKHHDNKY